MGLKLIRYSPMERFIREEEKSIVVVQNPLSFVVWGAQSERVVLEEVSFYLDLFFLIISWTPSFFSLLIN